MPTDRGYRLYVDELLAEGHPPVPRRKVELSTMRREVDEAMRHHRAALAGDEPARAGHGAADRDRHDPRIEVLQLQPQVTMVVVITSTGGVTKRVISYEEPVDSGLVAWAASYLNEALGNMDVGSRMVLARLNDAALSQSERDFLAMAPAFTELEQTPRTPVHGGRSPAAGRAPLQELSQIAGLMEVLEHRRAAGRAARSLTEPSVYLRIGEENPTPALQSVSIVAANYGLARRNLGAVSVIGPVRMDYPGAIGAVRDAARELSRFVAEVYDE